MNYDLMLKTPKLPRFVLANQSKHIPILKRTNYRKIYSL